MNWSAFFTSNILPVLLAGIIGFGLATQCTKTDWVPPVIVDEMLDENTRVLTAQITDLQQLKNEIETYSKAQAERIAEQNERIVALTRIAGRLNIYRDSVATLTHRIQFVQRESNEPEIMAPVGLTHTQSFSNGLFVVDCHLAITSSGCISMEAELRQERDINIVHTLTEQSPGIYNAYLFLPDFNREETQELVSQPPPEIQKSWWESDGRKALRYGLIAIAGLKLIEILF